MLEPKPEHGPSLEIVLVTRDAEGNPTGKKSFASDSAYKLSQFYLRHKGKPKHRVTPKIDKNAPIKKFDNVAAYVDNSERVLTDEELQQWNEEGVDK